MSAQLPSNISLTLAYDGTQYFGWQKTKEGPSIEQALEDKLSLILQQPVALQAASRTDRGVHASGQVVNFYTQRHPPLEKLHKSLNKILPRDLVVKDIQLAPHDFHPTTQCTSKIYRYYVDYGLHQLPCYRHFAWHIPAKLDLSLVRAAKDDLIGTHHFKAFCNEHLNCQYEDYMRTIYAIKLEALVDKRLVFEIHGNHFLYKMVRNIVGSLIDIGRGRLHPETLALSLQSGLRADLGVTAPCHGLFLEKVFY